MKWQTMELIESLHRYFVRSKNPKKGQMWVITTSWQTSWKTSYLLTTSSRSIRSGLAYIHRILYIIQQC